MSTACRTPVGRGHENQLSRSSSRFYMDISDVSLTILGLNSYAPYLVFVAADGRGAQESSVRFFAAQIRNDVVNMEEKQL